MQTVELCRGIILVEGERGGKYPSSNSLLVGEESFILVDTGFSLSPQAVKELKENFRVEAVVNSHCHEDHILMNHLFQDAQICCHRLDAPAVRSVTELNNRYFTPKDRELAKLGEQFLRVLLNLKDSKVDFEFENGYTFNLDVTKMTVLYAPGHSAGHCCFYFPREKVVFLSDYDLTSFGPWYGGTDSSLTETLSSVEKLKSLEAEVAVTSHRKDPIRGHDEILKLIEEYVSKIQEREKQILDALRGRWMSADELADLAIIYRRFPEPKDLFKVSERIMIEKHLEALLEKGKVKKQGDKFTAANDQ
ncbi:MAG: MBL fold metallo-hydrolase [Candidatus Jordarchaeales archaeon]|nr:MBL fold metallo-hydrolase [Candidatus Jordarchaeia archaeon]